MSNHQPTSRAIAPLDSLKQTLSAPAMQSQYLAALPKHISVERFQRVLLTAISTTPALVNADRPSLFAAVLKSAQDGLLPDGKESALVPFGDKITYMPMVAGILKKMRNSGELKSITAQIVYKNDQFRYWIDDTGEHLEYIPADFMSESGEAVGVFALAVMKDGATYIEVMKKAQVEAVQNVSRSKSSGPWAGPFKLEMWKKTVIRRISKKMPMSTDLEVVFQNDDEDYDFNGASNSTSGQTNQTSNLSDQSNSNSTSTEKSPSVQSSSKTSRLDGVIKNKRAARAQEPESELIENEADGPEVENMQAATAEIKKAGSIDPAHIPL